MATLKRSDSVWEGYNFTLNGNNFFIGLFYFDKVNWPGTVYPALLLDKGTVDWEVIHQSDTIWDDVKEDIYTNPEDLAVSIIRQFNKVLEQYQVGGELSYEEKLSNIFRFRLVLDKGFLKINP